MEFTLHDLLTLIMLIVLQAVLGLDNLLYISLESKGAPKDKQAMVRRTGIGVAIILRIGLLFLLLALVKSLQASLFELKWEGTITGRFNFHSLIVLFGGAFIIYTAIKEIWHMITLHGDEGGYEKKEKSVGKVITLIVIMNLIFSFDSILSAMALTSEGGVTTTTDMWVMVIAIVISGILMIWLSGTVSRFLQKNRMYEVLGLFILLIVGVMLLTEGGELAHLHLFGLPVEAMSKTTFYFVIFVLVLIDIVQGRYQKKLIKQREMAQQKN